MKTKEQMLQPDIRTQEQKDFDEAVANAVESGNWEGSGFVTTELLTEEGARQIIEFSETLDCNLLAIVIKAQHGHRSQLRSGRRLRK